MRILEHLLGRSGYNKKGEEIPDPTPSELVIDREAELPMEVKVMRALRSEEWARRMDQQGLETFEEANDFDIPEEEPEFRSIHEEDEGDMLAFEEGVRRGFVEEIPEVKRETARKIKAKADELLKEKAGVKKGEAS